MFHSEIRKLGWRSYSKDRIYIDTIMDRRYIARLVRGHSRGFLGDFHPNAQVAELVDALVSGISGAIRGGSSPLLGTNLSPGFLFKKEPRGKIVHVDAIDRTSCHDDRASRKKRGFSSKPQK